MIGWDLLLGAALEAGLGLLAEAGFGDEVRDLKERLTRRTEKARRAAFDRACDQAVEAVGDESLRPLLAHQPFRDAVVAGLLDPEMGFDLKALAEEWGEGMPVHARTLRRFFSSLENALLADEIWGPPLDRYQELRFREDVLAALQTQRLDVPPRQLVAELKAGLIGSGAIAQGNRAAAAGAGGVAVSGGVVGAIVQTVIQEYRVQVPPPQPGLQPENLRRRYLAELAAETNRLPWASLDPDYADPSRGESLGLVDVYTALDTTQLERVESEDQLRAYLSRQEEARRIPAQTMIDDQPRLVLLGDPGSGKSTLVNFLAYVLTQAGRAESPDEWLKRLQGTGRWTHGALLPVRVVLRDFAAGLPEDTRQGQASLLLSHLRHTLETWGLIDFWPHLHAALTEPDRPLLILLDGLDEVPFGLRQFVVDAVNDMAGRYPDHRYLVTCRIYAYVGQPCQLHGFHQATLAAFNGEQMAHFVDAWYDELARRGRFTAEQARTRAVQLKAAVDRPDLRGLAERPLLLTVMALLHTFRGQLPEDRVELYRWTVDLLLRRWEARIGDEQGILEALNVPGLKMSDLEAGLYEVAFRAHAGQSQVEGTADVAEADLRQWLAPYLGGSWDRAGQFVDYIRERAGLLVRHKPEAYTFPHRTFQEYLAACHLLAHPDYPGQAAHLARSDPDRWREVFVLAAGQAARTHRLGSALGAVNALCPKARPAVRGAVADEDWLAAILAGEALLEVGLVGVRRDSTGQALLERMGGWLAALMGSGSLAPTLRASGGDVLAQLGDPRFREDAWYLPDEPLLGFVEVPAGLFLMGTREEDIPLLLERFKGEREWYAREVPEHEVTLPTYYVARYPVTHAQYLAFVRATGHPFPTALFDFDRPYEWRDGQPPSRLLNHPVVLVTWYDARAYCQWLTEQLRAWEGTPEPLAGLLRAGVAGGPPWVVRLPSEAEWEKAARGTEGGTFPWGNEPDPNRANYDESGVGTTSAVGCFPGGASPYGVMDMSGNVWEWCRTKWQESYQDYEGDDLKGPANDLEGEARRVLRGGAFGYNVRYVRCAWRGWGSPVDGYGYYGFRLCVAPGFL